MSRPPTNALPPELVDRLRALLGDELPAFLTAAERPAVRGLRANHTKITAADLRTLLGPTLEPALHSSLEPVSWCPTGLRLPPDENLRLGDHPAHRAGLFYLQEPSAMSAAEVLAAGLADALHGARVIDLAAAPGGKTTRLTELVGPHGVVVANEIERKRLAVLHQNLDRWGAANVVTCSRPIDALADRAPAAFDAVLLDAPCTGEGMFRRDPQAIRHWSVAAVHGSARRQERLLAAAGPLVAPGGVLVYSTCTFATEENEERIEAFVRDHPGWTIEGSAIEPSFSPGIAIGDAPTERTARLWPHRLAGEGHFVALLRRERAAAETLAPEPAAPEPGSARSTARTGKRRRTDPAEVREPAAWREFAAATVPDLADAPVLMRDDRVFARPTRGGLPDELLARPGLPLGRIRPGRFEPAQALAGHLHKDRVAEACDWPADDPRWRAYVEGAEVADTGPDSWVLICASGWGIGWARRRGNVLKNFLPPALRSRQPR